MASLILSLTLVACICTCDAFAPSSSTKHNPQRHASTSQLRLFDSLLQKTTRGSSGINSNNSISRSSLNRIPIEEFDILSRGFGLNDAPPFPYSIELSTPKSTTNNGDTSNQPTRLVIRHLEEEDITKVMPEVVREFGALSKPPAPTSPQPGDEVSTQIENWLFSMTVLIGLTQRVERRKVGYPSDNNSGEDVKCPDHNVICIVEQTPSRNSNGEQTTYSEEIVGIAELSYQPPNPNRNAPPFVLPFFAKTVLSKVSPSIQEDGTALTTPQGYISNVLVNKNRRGLGYGRIMMTALEGMARMWGCSDIRLHVDANEVSGRVAQKLYRSLGYAGVPDRASSKKRSGEKMYEWMGPSMANEGLYMVDGIPLLYMRKRLNEEVE